MSNTKPHPSRKRKKKKSAANRKKNLTLAVVIALGICAVAIIILYFAEVIRFDKSEPIVNNRTGVAYVNYSDSNMIINSEGKVLERAEVQPEDIPQLTGIEFTRIVVGEYLRYDTQDAFEYAVKLVMALRDNDIQVREININAELEATAYVNNITILFGKDEKTQIKAADLADFYDQVKDLRGTLHMEEVNDKLGYTFKQESENTAIIQEKQDRDSHSEETTTSGEQEEMQEEYYEEPAYEEEYYEEEPAYEEEQYYEEEPAYEEEYYEEPVYEEEQYYEEPVYEEEYYEEPAYDEPLVYEEPAY